MGTRNSVRLGIVGLGFMGDVHAENAESFGHDVVSGADPSEAAREAFARTYGATPYASFDAMFDDEDLDAVAVAAPNVAHEPAVVGALERGLDVLCEKPLAHDLESAERIAAAAADAEGFCAVNFHNRVSTAAVVLADYLAEGRLGEVSRVEASYVRRRGIPGRGSWFTAGELAGGGAVLDIGVHAIDFALFLLGYPPVEEVFAVTRTDFGRREDYADPGDPHVDPGGAAFDVEDAATATIRCAGGRAIDLDVAWAANRPGSKDVLVGGADAGAELELGGEELTMYWGGRQGTDHFVDADVTGGAIDRTGWAGSDERFLDAVAAGESPDLATVEEALTVQRVADAIYRSAEKGSSVTVA